MRLRSLSGHPVVVRERIARASRLDTRVIRRRFFALLEIGESDGCRGRNLRRRWSLRRL